MDRPIDQITVETLTSYSEKDARDIGLLLTHLSDKFDGSTVPEEVLQNIISSPHHAQLVARDSSGKIVGAATVSVIMGAGSAKNAWLEDFVVDTSLQGFGIGGKLWDAVVDWCKSKGARNLNFTSRPSREAAQAFYLKRGAVVRETNFFRKKTL